MITTGEENRRKDRTSGQEGLRSSGSCSFSPVSLVLRVCNELCRLAAAEELRGGCGNMRVIRTRKRMIEGGMERMLFVSVILWV